MKNKNQSNKINNVLISGLINEDLSRLRYFFSLVLEDYFGDKEELMKMADIDENLFKRI